MVFLLWESQCCHPPEAAEACLLPQAQLNSDHRLIPYHLSVLFQKRLHPANSDLFDGLTFREPSHTVSHSFPVLRYRTHVP